MKPLRVALIAKRFPKISETFVMNHIIAMMERGYEVDVYSLRRPNPGESHHESVDTHGLIKRTIYLNDCKRKDYRTLFAGKRYDVIHCHFGNVAYRMSFLKELYPVSKFLVTFHGYDLRMGFRRNGMLYRNLFLVSDAIIAVCQNNHQQLIALGCPAEKIIHVPNGVNTKRFLPKSNTSNEGCRITSVTRFTKAKNVTFALKVMKALKEEGCFFRYTVVAGGKEKARIESMINDCGLNDHVSILGPRTEKDVLATLERTDLFLLPSRDEAFPVSLLEAQSMGIPVVATNVGGVSEAIRDGHTGFLVDSDDVSQAKSRLLSLIESPSLRKEMGWNGRRWVEENFHDENVQQKLWKVYECS